MTRKPAHYWTVSPNLGRIKQWSARRWAVVDGAAMATGEVRTAPSLQMLQRDFKSMGLARQEPDEGMAADIVEIWL